MIKVKTSHITDINNLTKKICHTFGYKKAVLTGRARSGLRALTELLGKDFNTDKIPVLIPENICSATVMAISAAGGIAVPVKVSHHTGLPSDQHFIQRMEEFPTPGIIMPTHLYGFRQNYEKTIKMARDNGWFVLENDAVATHACQDLQLDSPFGDAMIVSFGYSKPLDVGSGGVILTNNSELANKLEAIIRRYPVIDPLSLNLEKRCMLARRDLRKGIASHDAELYSLETICERELELNAFRFEPQLAMELADKLDHFPEVLSKRKKLSQLWIEAIGDTDQKLNTVNLPQPVPWRVIFYSPNYRKKITEVLWKNGFDVGINYGSLWKEVPHHYLFGQPPSEDRWGREVINLWVTEDYDEKRILRACKTIKRTLSDE